MVSLADFMLDRISQEFSVSGYLQYYKLGELIELNVAVKEKKRLYIPLPMDQKVVRLADSHSSNYSLNFVLLVCSFISYG
jgi:hypothetical protein